MTKNMILIGAFLTSSLLYGEIPTPEPHKQISETAAALVFQPHEQTPEAPVTLVSQFKAFKKQCDESGTTAITQNILMGIGIQCALVFGWNNQLTQEAVNTIKQSLTDFCIKHGINNIGFINTIIAGINQTCSLETIPTTGQTYFYTSVFTHLMELATDPIACSIWYMIFYKAVTVGPAALLTPQTLLTTVLNGTVSGLLSQYISTAAGSAISTMRELVARIVRL